MTTIDSVREAVVAVALAPLPDDDQAPLFDLGIIDSFALLNLVSRLEKSLGVTIPAGDIVPRRFATIARIAGLVEARKK